MPGVFRAGQARPASCVQRSPSVTGTLQPQTRVEDTCPRADRNTQPGSFLLLAPGGSSLSRDYSKLLSKLIEPCCGFDQHLLVTSRVSVTVKSKPLGSAPRRTVHSRSPSGAPCSPSSSHRQTHPYQPLQGALPVTHRTHPHPVYITSWKGLASPLA